MTGRQKSASARKNTRREPSAPDLSGPLTAATLPDHELDDSGTYSMLEFAELDLSGSIAELAELDQCRFRSVNISQAQFRRTRFVDTEFDRCDLANVRARECAISRAAMLHSRMTGFSWLAGELRDVRFDGCRIDLASFRASTFKDVLFTGCKLTQADFGDADLRGVRFERCDLSGAQFSSARLTGARIADCDLTGIGGITSLRGASIKASDAVGLAYLLADALGITIADDDDEA